MDSIVAAPCFPHFFHCLHRPGPIEWAGPLPQSAAGYPWHSTWQQGLIFGSKMSTWKLGIENHLHPESCQGWVPCPFPGRHACPAHPGFPMSGRVLAALLWTRVSMTGPSANVWLPQSQPHTRHGETSPEICPTAMTCLHPPVVARRRIMSSNLLISDEALRPSGSMMFVLLQWHTGCSWFVKGSRSYGLLWQMLMCWFTANAQIQYVSSNRPIFARRSCRKAQSSCRSSAGKLKLHSCRASDSTAASRSLNKLPQLWVTMTCARFGPSLLKAETENAHSSLLVNGMIALRTTSLVLCSLGAYFQSGIEGRFFLIELQEAPQSHPPHWKFFHLSGPVHIFMWSLLVSAMVRLFDFPATLAPLTPFTFGHPVAAGQKENGHSISQGIKSLNKKHDHRQRVIAFMIQKHRTNTCWNKQKREHEAKWYTQPLQTSKPSGSSQGRSCGDGGLIGFCQATNPPQLQVRLSERANGHDARCPIAQQCDASYCDQTGQSCTPRVPTPHDRIDQERNGKQNPCCPKDLGPHQSAKAATAVVPIRRLLQEIQPWSDERLHPAGSSEIQQPSAEFKCPIPGISFWYHPIPAVPSPWLLHSHRTQHGLNPVDYGIATGPLCMIWCFQPFSPEKAATQPAPKTRQQSAQRRDETWVDSIDILNISRPQQKGRSGIDHQDQQVGSGQPSAPKFFVPMDLLKTFQSPKFRSWPQNLNSKWSWNVVEVKQDNQPKWLQEHRCEVHVKCLIISVIRLFPSYLSMLPSLRAKSTDIMADASCAAPPPPPGCSNILSAMAGKSPNLSKIWLSQRNHQKHISRILEALGVINSCVKPSFWGKVFSVFTGNWSTVVVRCNNRRR